MGRQYARLHGLNSANYDSNIAFEIDVFKDRVTIYSPGHFPRGYTPEGFASGTQKPVMLNPRIVEVLFRTGRIESFGSGFERTFLDCGSEGVDYSYNETKSGFEFIFFRPLGHKNVREMSKTEKLIVMLRKTSQRELKNQRKPYTGTSRKIS